MTSNINTTKLLSIIGLRCFSAFSVWPLCSAALIHIYFQNKHHPDHRLKDFLNIFPPRMCRRRKQRQDLFWWVQEAFSEEKNCLHLNSTCPQARISSALMVQRSVPSLRAAEKNLEVKTHKWHVLWQWLLVYSDWTHLIHLKWTRVCLLR